MPAAEASSHLPDYIENMQNFMPEYEMVFQDLDGPYSIEEVYEATDATGFMNVLLGYEDRLYDDEGNIFVPAEYREQITGTLKEVEDAGQLLEQTMEPSQEPPELMQSYRDWGWLKNGVFHAGWAASGTATAITGVVAGAKAASQLGSEPSLPYLLGFFAGELAIMMGSIAGARIAFLYGLGKYETRKAEKNLERTGEYLVSELEGHRLYFTPGESFGTLKSNGKIQDSHPVIEKAFENLEEIYPDIAGLKENKSRIVTV